MSSLAPAGVALVVDGAAAFEKTLSDATGSVDDLGKSSDKASGGGLKALGSALSVGVAAGAAVAVSAVAAVGAALNAAAERTAAFRQVLGQDFPIDQIQAVSSEAALLERRFGADLTGQLDAARQLVANGLAPDLTSAFDIITAGFDEGLNVGDDFLDTLREYSPNLAQLGLDGNESLGAINRFLEAGGRNADVAADALKEFGILIQEPATLAAVGQLDEGLGGIVTQFQNGEIAGDQALSLLTDRLAAIEDPILQNQAGIALFGTKWEDAGAQAILALGQMDEGLIDSAGAADAAQQRITSVGEILPMIGDKIISALIPAGDALVGFANQYWPAFSGGVDTAISTAQNFASALGGNAEALAQLPGPLQNVVAATESAKAGWEAFGNTPLGTAITEGAQNFATYMTGQFGTDLQNGIGVVQGALNTFAASPWGQQIQAGAEVVASYFLNDWTTDLSEGVQVVTDALKAFGEFISPWTTEITEGAQVAADYMLNDFPKDFSAGVDAVVEFIKGIPKAVEEFIGGIPGKLAEFSQFIIDAAAQLGKDVIAGIEQGLDRQSGGLYGKVKGIIQAALGAGQAEAETGSPSELFARELGVPITQGIGEGMLRAEGDVTGAGGLIVDNLIGSFVQDAPSVGKASQEWVDAINEVLGRAAGDAVDNGEAISLGTADGILQAAGSVQAAASQVADTALNTMQGVLKIASPSQVFADDVGQPIVAGIAAGMLDNLDIVLDAAKDLGNAVLEEARAFASTLTGALNPIIEASLTGASGFARGQAGALDSLSGLFPGTDELNSIADEIFDLRDELKDVQSGADTAKIKGERDKALKATDDAITKLQDERLKAAGKGDEQVNTVRTEQNAKVKALQDERAGLAYTAANNIDPAKREQAAQKLIELDKKIADAKIAATKAIEKAEQARADQLAKIDERITAAQTKRQEQEIAYNDKITASEKERAEAIKTIEAELVNLQAQYNESDAILARQNAIAQQAQKALQEAQAEALKFSDPAERQAFFDLRQKQILETAKLEQEIAATSNVQEKARLEERLKYITQAQQFEATLYAEQAKQRAKEQQDQLRVAQDAIKQLGNLVFYSQEDVFGTGQDIIRGITSGIVSEVGTLRDVLGDALDDVLAQLRQALGIASPSKVFASMIGAPLMQGIGAGFAAEQPRIAAQLAANVQALVRPVASAASMVTNSTSSNNSISIGAIDARGAAPGVGREIQTAIRSALSERGRRADVLRRVS